MSSTSDRHRHEGTRLPVESPAPRALLRFALPAPSSVTITVCEANGTVLRVLREGIVPAGEHLCAWDGHGPAGRPVSPGTYCLRLEVNGRPVTSRVVTTREAI